LDIGLPPVLKWAKPAVRDRVVPEVLAGEKIMALAVTEPSGGSDVANLKTRAVKEGDFYRVSGSKPEAPYKPGRATRKGQELWRVKPWADAEILVTGITEGEVNTNEAKKNALGRTERSSAKAGMVANGQIGSIQGVMLADFHDPFTGKLLFPKDLPVTVGSGEMTVAEAEYYFRNPNEIIGHVVKFKHMTHGVKDKPRFPTYVSHRLPQDMS
jgi:hypothetical protein